MTSSNLTSAEVPGIDRDRVAAWLVSRDERLKPPFAYELVAGGRSNLTFRIEDAGGHEFVLRRPPLGHTLPSAHDMGREYRILSALQDSTVPVPRPIAICEDAAVSGATFYAMEYVDGWILRTPEVTERAFPTLAERASIADSLVSVLVDLHLVDPEAVGLGELGRHSGYIERQLKRWNRQWADAKTREIPAVEEVFERLSTSVPEQQRVSLVHGDYRLDNVVSGRDATVAAVLDWELCTLGDPLADLGGLLVSWVQEGEDDSPRAGGHPERAARVPHPGGDHRHLRRAVRPRRLRDRLLPRLRLLEARLHRRGRLRALPGRRDGRRQRLARGPGAAGRPPRRARRGDLPPALATRRRRRPAV